MSYRTIFKLFVCLGIEAKSELSFIAATGANGSQKYPPKNVLVGSYFSLILIFALAL